MYAGGPSRPLMAGASRYCKKSFVYPSFYTREKDFIKTVNDFIRKNEIGTYIPIHEEILIVSKYINEFTNDVVIPIDDYQKIFLLYNKDSSGKLAYDLGVPVPETFRVKRLNDLKSIKNEVRYPVVIKLQKSNGAKGIRYIFSKEALEKEYYDLIGTFNVGEDYPLIQEYVSGTMYAVSLLSNGGDVVAYFVRRNIREKQYEGGTCTKCISVNEIQLVEYAKRMLAYLKYTGVSMFEFKVNRDTNQYWLIEVNPRYWGTVSLDIDCCVEFPYYQYCLANNISFKTSQHYREGIKSRWIIGDFIGFLDSSKKSKNKFRNFLKYLKIDEQYFMDFKLDDPLPFFIQVLYYIKQFLKFRSINPVEEGMIS